MNELLASLGLTRYIWDVCAGNAKVVKFASRELVQLIDSIAVTAPVVVRADQVHFSHLVKKSNLFVANSI